MKTLFIILACSCSVNAVAQDWGRYDKFVPPPTPAQLSIQQQPTTTPMQSVPRIKYGAKPPVYDCSSGTCLRFMGK